MTESNQTILKMRSIYLTADVELMMNAEIFMFEHETQPNTPYRKMFVYNWKCHLPLWNRQFLVCKSYKGYKVSLILNNVCISVHVKEDEAMQLLSSVVILSKTKIRCRCVYIFQ